MLSPITMILRGYNQDEVACVAEVLLGSTYVKNMEITMNTENALEIIEFISKEYGAKLNVGAGTVQTFSELEAVVKAGATFALSPRMMTPEMLSYCKRHNVLSIPGAFTASEIADSYYQGGDVIKIFPANEVSISYANKVKEPMGNIPLMAVGGINASNVFEALEGGYDYIGTAGGLFHKVDIKNKDKNAMMESLKTFEAEVARFFNKK